MSGKYILVDRTPVATDDLGNLYGRAFEKGDRHVGKTEVVPGVEVSTVFLGIDHSFGSGPPLLFETMVFGGPNDQDQRRYSTWEEAEAGHAEWVERERSNLAGAFYDAGNDDGEGGD